MHIIRWNVECTSAHSETGYKIWNVQYPAADSKSEFANGVSIAHQYIRNMHVQILSSMFV